jgi:hypothetical protein
MYRIEAAANRIGKIVSTYETERDGSSLRALQELDTAYQVNDLEPHEILEASKRRVADLITQNRQLKEDQTDMLGSLATWMRREEEVLRDQEDMRAPARVLPEATSNDLLGILTSTDGTTQDRISRAMALHSEMMSRAFLAISQLQRANDKQPRSLSEMSARLKAQEDAVVSRRPRRADIHSDEQTLRIAFRCRTRRSGA